MIRRRCVVQHVFQILEPTPLRLVLALGLVGLIALVRAPYTEIPDALFVSDGFGYFIYLPSVFIDHDLDLSNQVTRIPYEGQKPFFRVSETTGRHTNQFPIGSAILWSPFYLAADASARGLQALGVPIERNGFGYWYELPVYLGSAAFGFVSIALMLRMLRCMFSPPIALASCFGVVFATPMAYYCWVEPNMSHTVATLAITVWVYCLFQIYRLQNSRWSAWVSLGLMLGMVALVRPYNGLLGLVAIPVAVSVFSSITAREGSSSLNAWQRACPRLVICCLAAFAVLTVQVFVWKSLYGQLFVIPRGSGYEQMQWISPTLGSYLSSVFLYTPLYGLGFLGLILGGRWTSGKRARTDCEQVDVGQDFVQLVAPWMAVVLVLICLVVAASRDWNLGTAFGQRRLVDWSIFFAIGMALLINVLQQYKRLAAVADWVVFGLAVALCCMAVIYLAKPGLLPEYGRVL